MDRRHREMYRVAAAVGAPIERVEQNAGHLKAWCRMPDGALRLVVFSCSASDRRALQNQRTVLRRLIREHQPKEKQA